PLSLSLFPPPRPPPPTPSPYTTLFRSRAHRGMGLVAEIFNEHIIAGLPGDVAIAHTRYSTAGTSVLANAQPVLAGYREGPLALRSEEHTSELQSRFDLVCRLLLEKKNK